MFLYARKKISLNGVHVLVRNSHRCLLQKCRGTTGHIVIKTLKVEKGQGVRKIKEGVRPQKGEKSREKAIAKKGQQSRQIVPEPEQPFSQ